MSWGPGIARYASRPMGPGVGLLGVEYRYGHHGMKTEDVVPSLKLTSMVVSGSPKRWSFGRGPTT